MVTYKIQAVTCCSSELQCIISEWTQVLKALQWHRKANQNLLFVTINHKGHQSSLIMTGPDIVLAPSSPARPEYRCLQHHPHWAQVIHSLLHFPHHMAAYQLLKISLYSNSWLSSTSSQPHLSAHSTLLPTLIFHCHYAISIQNAQQPKSPKPTPSNYKFNS